MPLAPPVIKIVSFVTFIIKCPAPIKDTQLPGTADTIHRTVSISPWWCLLARRPTETSCDSRPDSPEPFRHVPHDPERDICERSSSQSANPIAKAPRLHYH